MKRFLAIIITMGLVQHQDIQDYWSTDELLETPFFKTVLTRILPFAPPCDYIKVLDIDDHRVSIVASSSAYQHPAKYAFDNGSYTNDKYWKPNDGDFGPMLTVKYDIDTDARVTMVSVEARYIKGLVIRIGEKVFPPIDKEGLDEWSEMILPMPVSNNYNINTETPITFMFMPLAGKPCIKNLAIEVCGNYIMMLTNITGCQPKIMDGTSSDLTALASSFVPSHVSHDSLATDTIYNKYWEAQEWDSMPTISYAVDGEMVHRVISVTLKVRYVSKVTIYCSLTEETNVDNIDSPEEWTKYVLTMDDDCFISTYEPMKFEMYSSLNNRAPCIQGVSIEVCEPPESVLMPTPTLMPLPSMPSVTPPPTCKTETKTGDSDDVIIDASSYAFGHPPKNALASSENKHWRPQEWDDEPTIFLTLDTETDLQIFEMTLSVKYSSKVTILCFEVDPMEFTIASPNSWDKYTIPMDTQCVSNEFKPLKISFKPTTGNNLPRAQDISFEVCAPRSSVTEAPVSTVTEAAVSVAPIQHECRFDPEWFADKYGASLPSSLLVDQDDIAGNVFKPETDSLEEGVILFVDCSFCECKNTGMECQYEPCVKMPTPPPGNWSPWGECVYGNGMCTPGIRTRLKLCGGPMTPCPVENTMTQQCPPPDYCATTTPSCGSGMIFVECVPCQITCHNVQYPAMPCEQPEGCVPGCVCPDDMVMYKDICIQEDDCPCMRNGEVIQIGEVVQGDTKCQVCECTENNRMDCYIRSGCCEYGTWGTWTTCSASCDGGNQTRSRSIISGDDECDDGKVEELDCNEDECPKPCKYHGIEYGLEVNVPGYSDDICEECYCTKLQDDSYDIICESNSDTEVDGDWSEWSEWGECSETCNGGSLHRYRDCINPEPRCGGDRCEGMFVDTIPCNEDVPCCEVISWSDWSSCSVTCGPGRKERNRHLVNTEETCDNIELQKTEDCNYGDCPDCTLTDWENWSECHSEDGCGMGSKSRQMVVPDSCDDVTPPTEEADCYVDCDCPSGQVWSNYSLCTKTCDQRDTPLDHEDCDFRPGCACQDGLFYDTLRDSCKTENECDACYVNQTKYENMDTFEHPYHPCTQCHCYRGQWEDSCKAKDCESTLCPPGSVARKLEGECCPTCVPVQDKCREYQKFDYMTDKDKICISKEKLRFSVCAGSCGNSRTDVLLMDPDGDSFILTKCKCCMAVMKNGEEQDVDVVCIHSDSSQHNSTAKYIPLERCECNKCSNADEGGGH